MSNCERPEQPRDRKGVPRAHQGAPGACPPHHVPRYFILSERRPDESYSDTYAGRARWCWRFSARGGSAWGIRVPGEAPVEGPVSWAPETSVEHRELDSERLKGVLSVAPVAGEARGSAWLVFLAPKPLSEAHAAQALHPRTAAPCRATERPTADTLGRYSAIS